MPDFRTTCQIHAAIFAALFAIYMLAPGLSFIAFDLGAPPEARFVARRAGIILLGVAAIAFLARGLPPSPARQAIVVGLIVIWGGLAAFGATAILRGVVGWTAWGTVVVEAVLAIILVPHLRSRPKDGSDAG
ncbi:hypothetical protein ROJ8625_03979 [Roseivivax jejudonensis]|uniref:DUF4345 domain-containing protein n=1 Tax=Roseivivax jejudonensis TaxID=1529041 RepID=A0A1X7A9D3_9RHOB|nr:hypothetical protein [Roseivivax jejudonensis]SLN73753.1 hypothetical protein ROJ8625_03979 [Roseivivax jejudonensis]